MRQVRYSVAMSLDGYIAGPNGEADWIVMDPDIDVGAIFSRFDTLLIGRKSFAAMQAMRGDAGGAGMAPGVRSVVISRTMLTLRSHRVYEKSGVVVLEYDVVHSG
jgi:dihydrofolate reductase